MPRQNETTSPAVVVSNDNFNLTPIETIQAIKEAGFKNVFIQWYNKEWKCSQDEQLSIIRGCGLNVVFAHLGYRGINSLWEDGEDGQKLVDEYKNDLDECKKNKIPMVVMHLTSKCEAPKYGKVGLDRIKDIADYARVLGIKVAFENTKIRGYLDYVISNVDQSNVGICFDSGHCHAHFDDDFNFDLFKNRIFAVHLHDNDKTDDSHLIPFDGTIDWDWLIGRLKECNYNDPVTLEVCYSENYAELSPVEFYRKSLKVAERISDKLKK